MHSSLLHRNSRGSRRNVGKLNNVSVFITSSCGVYKVLLYSGCTAPCIHTQQYCQPGRRADIAHVQPCWLLWTSVNICYKLPPRGPFCRKHVKMQKQITLWFKFLGVFKTVLCFINKKSICIYFDISDTGLVLLGIAEYFYCMMHFLLMSTLGNLGWFTKLKNSFVWLLSCIAWHFNLA